MVRSAACVAIEINAIIRVPATQAGCFNMTFLQYNRFREPVGNEWAYGV
jgi:hypothetical protein